jgi:hypothetical protein
MFEAITTTRSVRLRSALVTRYVFSTAPAISTHAAPAVLHRCHW